MQVLSVASCYTINVKKTKVQCINIINWLYKFFFCHFDYIVDVYCIAKFMLTVQTTLNKPTINFSQIILLKIYFT